MSSFSLNAERGNAIVNVGYARARACVCVCAWTHAVAEALAVERLFLTSWEGKCLLFAEVWKFSSELFRWAAIRKVGVGVGVGVGGLPNDIQISPRFDPFPFFELRNHKNIAQNWNFNL